MASISVTRVATFMRLHLTSPKLHDAFERAAAGAVILCGNLICAQTM